MNRGLPAFNIVGMANKTVNEAKERVRSAIINSEFSFPDKKVMVNLAPAELPKNGTHLDLPIALSILVLSGQLIKSDVADKIFVGELSLNGELKPVKGIINIIETAKRSGYTEIYVPAENLRQAALVKGPTIYGARTLQELFLALKRQMMLPTAEQSTEGPKKLKNAHSGPILDHIRGQNLAKRAMAIAIAGHHNIVMSGPPGDGKALVAQAAANLLPDLTPEAMIDITKIYSIAGLTTDEAITKRPFRSPHHTASVTSITGGLSGPGEISLAHKGILFLDEILEFPRSALETLRQPLEDKRITISRANQKLTYPADFMLVATMNPCPCGYLGDPTHECKCTESQIQKYQGKLSGPLFDRIDMNVTAERVENTDLLKDLPESSNEHDVVKNTITGAIMRQKERYGRGGFYNSSLSSFDVSQKIKMKPATKKLLAEASERLNLSARAYFKTIKVAQTIADLDGADIVDVQHLAEALNYRRR